MKFIKKEVLPVIAILVFIGAYIGSAHAAQYYYFDALPGLVEAEAYYPFCETENCVYDNETGVDLDIVTTSLFLSTGVELANTYTLTGDAEITVASSDGDIIDASNFVVDEVNKTITIAGEDVLDIGEVTMTVSALVDGVVADQDTFSVTVSDYACDSLNPLAGIVIADASWNGRLESTYILGETASGSSNSDLAKKQLLCMSNNQIAAVLAGNYELTADVDFDINVSTRTTYESEDGSSTSTTQSNTTHPYLSDIKILSVSNNEDWNADGVVDDLDVNSSTNLGGWTPIGSRANKFTGNFDGGGNTITNLFLNRDDATNATLENGFFGGVKGTSAEFAIIKNIGFKDAVIFVENSGNTWMYSGAVSGIVEYSDISNSYSEDFRIYFNATVNSGIVGGLVGLSKNASVSNSYATGVALSDVNSRAFGGVLVGFAEISVITSCYAEGYVQGHLDGNRSSADSMTAIGVMAGAIHNTSVVSNVYAVGTAYSRADNTPWFNLTGGIAGFVWSGINKIENSYADVKVKAVGVCGQSCSEGSIVGATETANMYTAGKPVYGLSDELNAIDDVRYGLYGSGVSADFCSDSADDTFGGATDLCQPEVQNLLWDEAIWSGLGTLRPTLKNMPNF